MFILQACYREVIVVVDITCYVSLRYCHGSDRDNAFALLFCFRHVIAYTRLLSSKRDVLLICT